jgi:hypothetical protein
MARRKEDPPTPFRSSKLERRRQQRDLKRHMNPWTRRRVIAWMFFVAAPIVAVQHIFAHLGVRPLPFGMGKQDIFLGFPMAFLLMIVGAMTLDPPSGTQKKDRR